VAVNHIYIDNILNHAFNIDPSNLLHTVFKIETIKLTRFFRKCSKQIYTN